MREFPFWVVWSNNSGSLKDGFNHDHEARFHAREIHTKGIGTIESVQSALGEPVAWVPCLNCQKPIKQGVLGVLVHENGLARCESQLSTVREAECPKGWVAV